MEEVPLNAPLVIRMTSLTTAYLRCVQTVIKDSTTVHATGTLTVFVAFRLYGQKRSYRVRLCEVIIRKVKSVHVRLSGLQWSEVT